MAHQAKADCESNDILELRSTSGRNTEKKGAAEAVPLKIRVNPCKSAAKMS
jgi:hypothetical protein